MNRLIYNSIYVITVCGLLYIICNNMFPNTEEGFNPGDITKITKSVNKIGKIADTIPKQINNINKQVDKKFTKFGDQVKNQTIGIVTDKLKSVFVQLGQVFNDGLVNPLLILFKGIGVIFVQIFGILKLIVDKVVSLPKCIFPYVITEFVNIFFSIYRLIIPSFLRNPLSSLYKYTFGYFINLISDYSGWSKTVNKCYGFNVDDEINSMNKQFTNINKTFTKDFGRLNFASIKI
jgi:hypothetical protein